MALFEGRKDARSTLTRNHTSVEAIAGGWQGHPRLTVLCSKRVVVAATSLLLVAISGFAVWRLFLYQSDLDKALAAFGRVYERARPTRSRMTALAYAPFIEARGAGVNGPDAAELERAKTRLFFASIPGDPASDHALGLLYLTQGDYDEAIHLLTSAVSEKPNNPQFHNDLGVAILEKAREDHAASKSGRVTRDDSTREFDDSLKQFRKALDLDARL